MFKLAVLLRSDGSSVDPFACQHLSSYLRNGIIITTQKMFELSSGFKAAKINIDQLVVIGHNSCILGIGLNVNGKAEFVKDIKAGIRYLSKKHSNREWWFVVDNETANDFILKGLVMDVHLTKSYGKFNSPEWKLHEPHKIDQYQVFNKTLLDRSDLEFSLVSEVNIGDTGIIKHYIRRNREESSLLAAMSEIITNGFSRPNRTGINTRSLFGKQFEYRMVERVDSTGQCSYRIPLLTTKKMFVRGVFGELKWFLNGQTDSKILENERINIWKGNSSRAFLDANGKSDYPEGECGPIYGFQWRHFGAAWDKSKKDYAGEGIDQVSQVIESLQNDPYSRRHIISGWNVSDLKKMCLVPCHVLYQFLVHEEAGQKYLTLMMSQRSCDVLLGLPFNICSLGLFLLMMSHRVGMKPYKIIHSVSDFHLYETHIEAAATQIKREPCMFPYIHFGCDPKDKLEDYNFEDMIVEDYYSHEKISADMVA